MNIENMKNIITIVSSLVIFTTTSKAQVYELLNGSSGTLSDGTTFAWSTPWVDNLGGDSADLHISNVNTPTTLQFSSQVNLKIDNWSINPGNFNTFNGVNGGSNVTFTADSGSWTITNNLSNKLSLTSSNSVLSGYADVSDPVIYSDEWGEATISGVTSVTFFDPGSATVSGGGGGDGYRFTVQVPEPSSTTLFGLGVLGLLARRKR